MPQSLVRRLFDRHGFVLAWAAAWGVIGCLVAFGISFSREDLDLTQVMRISILFAEVVGFTALLSTWFVFPLYRHLPYAVRVALQVVTLLSGAVFGSVLVIAWNPIFSLAAIRPVALVILVNGLLSVTAGIGLHTYDSMRQQIERSFQALREKELIDRQVQIAQEVQRELFPRSVPQLQGLELAGVCLPSFGIGGDYYDFLEMDPDRVGLVVADVSGKGIPAALLMASVQAAVRGLALPSISVAEINQRLNEVLYRSTSSSRYATLFFGVYDSREGALTYSNAGHNPPIQIGDNGTTKLHSGGIPLGVLDDSCYQQETRRIDPGDLIVLYTDGVTEATAPDGREFGEERLVEILARNRMRSLDEMLQIVLVELKLWLAGVPPHDDVTLVLARAPSAGDA